MAVHESFLDYRRFRYLKLSAGGLGGAIAAYALHRPQGSANGGTWLGTLLGAASAGIIVWLVLLGHRKRSYFAHRSTVRGWVSAHVYLGTALLVLVPLHAGFQFGANVHTAAFVLMAIVVLSGMVGVALYVRLPERIADNLASEREEDLLEQVATLDVEAESLAQGLPDVLARATRRSLQESRLGGGLLARLRADERGCGTAEAIETVLRHQRDDPGGEREPVRRLLELLAIKQATLRRLRRHVRLKALLDVWLLVHVPFSFATVAAVAVHIAVVLFYR